MFPDLSVLDGGYLRDILDQPASLRATFAGLYTPMNLAKLAARLKQGKFQRVVLTGMGSSFHALHPLNLQLIGAGFTALMVETSELIHYESRFFTPRTLLIVVSQSGLSVEIVRLLELNQKHSPIIAVSNSPDSPLCAHADASLLTRAGAEFSVSCKTYVTALMALTWLGDVLSGTDTEKTTHELAQTSGAVEEYLSDWKQHVRILAARLKGLHHLFLVGRGVSLAAVGTGALIIKESAHFHAEGMSSAGFRHGPFEMLSDETFVIVFAGDPRTRELNHKLCQDIREQNGRTELVGDGGSSSTWSYSRVPVSLLPIMEILPVQMITLALASATGREPGKFELASKVTTVE